MAVGPHLQRNLHVMHDILTLRAILMCRDEHYIKGVMLYCCQCSGIAKLMVKPIKLVGGGVPQRLELAPPCVHHMPDLELGSVANY